MDKSNIRKWVITLFKIENRAMQPFLPSISHTSDSYPCAVLLSMLSPVVPSVTKHQQVACKPIRAAVTSLCGHGSDFGPSPQIHFQPLVRVRGERRPASSTCNGDRQSFSCVYVWVRNWRKIAGGTTLFLLELKVQLLKSFRVRLTQEENSEEMMPCICI